MPPLAAIGAVVASSAAAVGTAVGGLTLAGVATGASIVGAGFSVVGAITGSKTMQKIGMGMGMVGGGAALAGGIRGMSSVAQGISPARSVTSSLLADPLKGSKMVDRSADLWKAPASLPAEKTSQVFGNGPSLSGGQNSNLIEAGSTYDPGTGTMGRAKSVWGEYAPWLSVAGGMGEAYMAKENMDMQKGIANRRLDIEQAHLDRLKQNTGAIGITLQPTTYTRQPLLQS